MSRCYPFPPPGYEKKAPPLSADVAQPTKKERHKHKEKRKKKKKDNDANGDAHDKDSSRSSKQPRTVLINDLLQPKEEKQNGRVRDVVPTAAVERPLGKGEVRDGGKATIRGVSEGTPPIAPQPLYNSKQEPNGKADAKPALVLLPKNSGSVPSSRPSSNLNFMQPMLPSNNVASQRQFKASDLPTTSACEIPALKQPDIWSETADEDWLFAGRPLESHPKPKAVVDDGAAEEPPLQVWAEAVYLPLVEIYALPYVVPY